MSLQSHPGRSPQDKHYRGSSNSNTRGSSKARRLRKQWLLAEFGDGVQAPCYLCGILLTFETITVDKIIPQVQGGTYRRGNIRPACSRDNSSTGGRLTGTTKKIQKGEPSVKIVLEDSDYDEAREVMGGVLDFVPTNEQVDAALALRKDLLPKVYAFGWSDAEVRDELASGLQGSIS